MLICSTKLFSTALQAILFYANTTQIIHVDNLSKIQDKDYFAIYCVKVPAEVAFGPGKATWYIKKDDN